MPPRREVHHELNISTEACGNPVRFPKPDSKPTSCSFRTSTPSLVPASCRNMALLPAGQTGASQVRDYQQHACFKLIQMESIGRKLDFKRIVRCIRVDAIGPLSRQQVGHTMRQSDCFRMIQKWLSKTCDTRSSSVTGTFRTGLDTNSVSLTSPEGSTKGASRATPLTTTLCIIIPLNNLHGSDLVLSRQHV